MVVKNQAKYLKIVNLPPPTSSRNLNRRNSRSHNIKITQFPSHGEAAAYLLSSLQNCSLIQSIQVTGESDAADVTKGLNEILPNTILEEQP